MKIVDFRVTYVALTLNAKLRHNREVHPGRIVRDKLRFYAEYFEKMGDYYGGWPRDAHRPEGGAM